MPRREPVKAFVVMPFGGHDGRKAIWTEIYEKIFKPALEIGLKKVHGCQVIVQRGDYTTTMDIRQKLTSHLCMDEFVLVDATLGNPNVMLELGVRWPIRDETLLVHMENDDQSKFLNIQESDQTLIADLRGMDHCKYTYNPDTRQETIFNLAHAIEQVALDHNMNPIREYLRSQKLVLPNCKNLKKVASYGHSVLSTKCPLWTKVWNNQMERACPHFEHIHEGIAVIEPGDFDEFMGLAYRNTSSIRCTALPSFTNGVFLKAKHPYGRDLLNASKGLPLLNGEPATERIFYEPGLPSMVRRPRSPTARARRRMFERQQKSRVEALVTTKERDFARIQRKFHQSLSRVLSPIVNQNRRILHLNVEDIDLDISGSVLRLPMQVDSQINEDELTGIFFHREFEKGEEIYDKYIEMYNDLRSGAESWTTQFR